MLQFSSDADQLGVASMNMGDLYGPEGASIRAVLCSTDGGFMQQELPLPGSVEFSTCLLDPGLSAVQHACACSHFRC